MESKLSVKFTNTPKDTSLVLCSVSGELNKEETKHDRIQLGLEKTHYNDAFVIAGGKSQQRAKVFKVQQIRRTMGPGSA